MARAECRDLSDLLHLNWSNHPSGHHGFVGHCDCVHVHSPPEEEDDLHEEEEALFA